MEDKITILYVDNDVNNLDFFENNFRKEWNIITAESGKEGLEAFQNNTVQVILSDYLMPEMTGIEFLAETLKLDSEPIRILISDHTNVNTIIEAVNKAQIYCYLTRPWDLQQLIATINAGLEVFKLRAENKELIQSLTNVNKQMENLLLRNLP